MQGTTVSSKSDKVRAATLWMEAMSKPGATQLKALAPVVAEHVAMVTRSGRSEVLEWMRSWPGKSMIRTGTWLEPAVVGGEVRVTCMFDAKAAYHRGELTLSFDADGIITNAAFVVSPAPEPLGGVILRVWGPRRGLDRLPDHLVATYGVEVKTTTALDNGVIKVDSRQHGRLVARVFPGDRPVAEVEGDAAVLTFLEKQGFPAERCAGPVSVLDGQPVLLTHFVEGKQPVATLRNATAMAGLLGRLHALKGGPKAARREAGGLHLYSADTTIESEVNTALACLEVAASRGTDQRYEKLRLALLEADDFAGLPTALSHPDVGFKNTIATKEALVPIDWAGVGKAPRVLALGMLLFYGSLAKAGWDPKRVDAMLAAYREHVDVTGDEVDHLATAMQHRMLIHETYAWCLAKAQRRTFTSMGEWPQQIPTTEAIADHVRTRLRTS